jgi:hypothetical protein
VLIDGADAEGKQAIDDALSGADEPTGPEQMSEETRANTIVLAGG